HHADALVFLQRAVDDTHQHHDAEIEVVPAIDQQRLEGGIAVAPGGWQAGNDRLQDSLDVEARLGRDQNRIRGIEADHVLDLLPDLVGLGGRQIDLVEDRHDLMVVVERLVDVRQRLCLDALARVHDQKRALAGRQAAVDLIGEIHMSWGVDQVEDIILAVPGVVVQPHRLSLDGDAALALDIHGIEHLLPTGPFPLGKAAGDLDQPVRKGRLAMVDMGDDGKISDVFDGGSGHVPHVATPGPGGKPGAECRNWSPIAHRGLRLYTLTAFEPIRVSPCSSARHKAKIAPTKAVRRQISRNILQIWRMPACWCALTARSTRTPNCTRWCAGSSRAASKRSSGAPSCSPMWSEPTVAASTCRSR